MLKSLKYIPFGLLTISLLVCGLAESAEAQFDLSDEALIGLGGGTSTLGDINDPTVDYTFSLFNSKNGDIITRNCRKDGQNVFSSCVFKDVVSRLDIEIRTKNSLLAANLGTINASEEFVPSSESGVVQKNQKPDPNKGIDDYLLSFTPSSELFNLKSEWQNEDSKIVYTLTSPQDNNPIALGFSSVDNQSDFGNLKTLGFQVSFVEDIDLRNSLVTNPRFILDALNMGSLGPSPSGFIEFQDESVEIRALNNGGVIRDFKPIALETTDVPEPASAIGLLIFALLGIKVAKKQLL